MIVKTYKFIQIETTDDPGWTHVIKNKRTGFDLGYIGYYPKWKQHVVQFREDAALSWDCLRDISEFLKGLVP